MKIKSLLFAAAFSISAFAFAADFSPIAKVVASETSGVYNVMYKSVSASKVKVSIYSASNVELFTETLMGQNSFVRPYNFNSMAEGEYTIIVEDAHGKTVEKINHTIEKTESLIRVIRLAEEPNKYMLSVVNKGTDNVTIAILNNAGEEIHSERQTVNGDFAVVYNITAAGVKPTFTVTSSNGNVKTISY